MKNGRWLIAGGLFLTLILDFVVVRNAMTHNLSPVIFRGAMVGVVLSIAVALTFVTQATRGIVLGAALLFFGWFGAFAAGSLYATCDLNMRPFVWQLLVMFGAPFLVGTGIILAVPFLLWGAGSIAYKFVPRRSITLAILLVIMSIPCMAIGTYFVETAAGARPTEGNCAI
ncbi:MAG: hypothetical protein WB615_09890 [Candidatus Tumulicola sp.]